MWHKRCPVSNWVRMDCAMSGTVAHKETRGIGQKIFKVRMVHFLFPEGFVTFQQHSPPQRFLSGFSGGQSRLQAPHASYLSARKTRRKPLRRRVLQQLIRACISRCPITVPRPQPVGTRLGHGDENVVALCMLYVYISEVQAIYKNRNSCKKIFHSIEEIISKDL